MPIFRDCYYISKLPIAIAEHCNSLRRLLIHWCLSHHLLAVLHSLPTNISHQESVLKTVNQESKRQTVDGVEFTQWSGILSTRTRKKPLSQWKLKKCKTSVRSRRVAMQRHIHACPFIHEKAFEDCNTSPHGIFLVSRSTVTSKFCYTQLITIAFCLN